MALFNLLKTLGNVAVKNPKTAAGLAGLAGLAGYNTLQNQLPEETDNEPLIPQEPIVPQQSKLPVSPLLSTLRGDAEDINSVQPGFNKYADISSEPLVSNEELRQPQSLPSEPISRFQQMLQKYINEPTPKRNLELNLPKERDYQALYDQARQMSEANKSDARSGKALDLLGGGLAGAIAGTGPAKPVMQEFYDEKLKQAEVPLEDFKNKLALEKKNPDSAYSQGLKQFLQSYGVKINGDLDAETAEKLIPNITKIYENDYNKDAQRQNLLIHMAQLDEAGKARKQTAELAQEAKKQEKETRAQERLDKDTTNRFDKMDKIIASEIASSRSAFGKAANIVRASEAIENLAKKRDLNSLTTREIQEVARSLDAVLSQGQPTITGTDKLVPSSYSGDIAKIKEYVGNIPKGAQMGAFLQQMFQTIKREKELAQEQIMGTQGKLLSGFSDLREKDPQKWDIILRSHNLPSELFEGGKTYQDIKKANTPETVMIKSKVSGKVKEATLEQAKELLAHPDKYEKVQ